MNQFIEMAIGTIIITVGMAACLAVAAFVIDFLFFNKKG